MHPRRQQTIVAVVAGKTATPELVYRAIPENAKSHDVLTILLVLFHILIVQQFPIHLL